MEEHSCKQSFLLQREKSHYYKDAVKEETKHTPLHLSKKQSPGHHVFFVASISGDSTPLLGQWLVQLYEHSPSLQQLSTPQLSPTT